MGKTLLLEAVRALAADASVKVAWARASELEREFGFGVLRQLLEPLVTCPDGRLRNGLFDGAAALAVPLFQCGPSPGEAVVEPDYATLHGLYWLLAELTDEQPLAVCVDDVQWADPPSLRFLSFASRRIDNFAATIFATLRTGDVGTDPKLVSQLVTEPGVRTVRPRPLTGKAVEAMVRRELSLEPSTDLVEACLESTGGIPFYLSALLGELGHSGGDVGPASVRQITEMGSGQIAAVLLHRLDALPAGAKHLARAVAVLGDGSDIRVAARLADLEPYTAQDVLHALVKARFLVGRDAVAFTHPIVRSSVYGSVPPGTRSALHMNAARLLEGEGARIEELARHLVHALPGAVPRTVETLRTAARRSVAVGAPESAAGFLRRALLEPPPPEEEVEVLLELGRAEMRAGMAEAVGHLEEVIHHGSASPEQRGLAALDLGEYYMHALRGEDGIAILEAGLAATSDIEPTLAKRIEATLVFNACGHIAVRTRLLPRVRALQPAMGTPVDDPTRLLFAALALDEVSGSGKASVAVSYAQECLAYRGPFLGSTEGTAMALAIVGLTGADRPVEAEVFADRMIDMARKIGSITLFSMASANRALVRQRRGNLLGAEADARAVLAIESYGGLEVVRPLAVATVVESLTARGEFEAAEVAAASIDRDRSDGAPTWQFLVAAVIDLRLAKREAQQAVEQARHFPIYEEAWGAGPGVGLYEWRWRAAAAHAAIGDEEGARAIADMQLSLAESFGSARALGIALRTWALLEAGPERIEMLRSALPHLPADRSALERTRTLVELGAALRRCGHRSDAREPLQEALELGRRCGALRLAMQAHTELRAAGGHPRLPLRTGLEALTASEQRVADMAARGLTNKEAAQSLFVTVKTIEMHLSNVYRKLGIDSRAKLRDVLTLRSTELREML